MFRKPKIWIAVIAIALIATLAVALLPVGVSVNTSGNLSITLGEYKVLASPGEVTYYFDAYHSTEKWTTTPEYAVDNVLTNYASTTVNNQVERLTGNTCPSDDLGTITKVEIRAYAYGDGNDELYLRPEFIGGTGNNHIIVPTTEGGWGAYQNITGDANAPDWSSWTHIQDLECDIELDDTAAGQTMYVSKVEIRVTYSTGTPKAGTPVFQSFNEGKNAAGTTVVVTKPVGVVEGDLLIGILSSDGKDETHTSPESDSWNDILVSITEGTNCTLSTWWKLATDSEPADYTFGNGSTEALYAIVLRIDGHHSWGPIDSNSTSATGDDTSAECPDITTQFNNELVLRIFGADYHDVTIDGGWASVDNISVDESDTGNGSCSGGVGEEDQAIAGSTGTEINTLTSTEEWVAFTIGIRENAVPVSEIDIGPAPIDRPDDGASYVTRVDKNNPANASGTLHSVKVYADINITSLTVGTFYTTNGNTLKCRDSEVIGAVEAGAERTFTSLSITVVAGDYIGCYFTAGEIDRSLEGYDGIWYASGAFIDPNDEKLYTFVEGDALSLYGYGDLAGGQPDITSAPNTWTLNGIIGDGDIQIDTIYYANPQGDTQAPASTVADGDCRFTVTNTSTMAIDLTCTMGAFTGGDGDMTNSDDGSNGATTYGAYSWFSGQLYANKVIIKSTGSSVGYDGLAATTDIMWGAEVETRTNAWTGGSASTATLTITATVD